MLVFAAVSLLLAAPPEGPPKLAALQPPDGTVGGDTAVTLRGFDGSGDAPFLLIDGPLGVRHDRASRATVTAPADAAPGAYRIRLATARGVATMRTFVLDDLRTLDAAAAMTLAAPCAVRGAVEAEKTITFKVSAKAGRRLTVEAVARRLGSPLDPHLRLCDAATNAELPGGLCDDAPGLQGDSRVSVVPIRDTDVLIELRDSTYRGGADYRYHLRVGDFPSALCCLPLAVPRGQTTHVRFAGPDVEGVEAIAVAAPADAALEAIRVAPRRGDRLGWGVPLLLSDHPEVVEAEPNDTPAEATPLPVPGGASGVFGKPNDRDCYRFAAKASQPLAVRATTSDLPLPTDLLLTILDAAGKSVAASDPAVSPPRIDFKPPADGDYVLVAEHLNYLHGPSEAYRVTVTPAAPGVTFALAGDVVKVPAGGKATLAVTTLTRRDYPGVVTFAASGPAGITVSGTLAAGVATPPPAKKKDDCDDPKPAKDAGPIGKLTVSVAADVVPGLYPVRVRAVGAKDAALGLGSVRTQAMAALAGLPVPPREWTTEVLILVTPAEAKGKTASP